MSKILNGIIALLSFNMDCLKENNLSLNSSRKVFDFKITNNFPIISFPKNTKMIIFDRENESLREVTVEHFSVPQNLRIHITTRTREHIYFDTHLINKETKELNHDFARLYTWFSGTISSCKQLMPIKRNGAVLITLLPSKLHHTERTGVFVDFYIHTSKITIDKIVKEPFQNDSCRITGNDENDVFGPLSLHHSDLFRKEPHNKVDNAFVTMRFGFYEAENEQPLIDIPFNLSQEEKVNITI